MFQSGVCTIKHFGSETCKKLWNIFLVKCLYLKNGEVSFTNVRKSFLYFKIIFYTALPICFNFILKQESVKLYGTSPWTICRKLNNGGSWITGLAWQQTTFGEIFFFESEQVFAKMKRQSLKMTSNNILKILQLSCIEWLYALKTTNVITDTTMNETKIVA